MNQLTITFLLAVCAIQQNDASKLFQRMEDKIVSAKTLQVAFTAHVEHKGKKLIAKKGSLLMAAGNKFYYELQIEQDGKQAVLRCISDGKHLVMTQKIGAGPGRAKKVKCPAKFTIVL